MKKASKELQTLREAYSPLTEGSKSTFRQTVARKLATASGYAFTLVELLIVIAIIGILAALLLPAISRSKYKAQQVKCAGNLHQLGVALQTFVADNHAYPSIKANTNSDNPGMWQSQLELGGFGISKPFADFVSEGTWRCPSARWNAGLANSESYGYNAFGILRIGTFPSTALGLLCEFPPDSHGYGSAKESEVVQPGDMMAIGESFIGNFLFMRQPDLNYLEKMGFASSRHQGKANVLFCDGHVESPTLKFLFVNTSDAALARWNRDHQPHRDKL